MGAPFYFKRQHEVGGAVYVYMNTGGRFDPRPSVVLKGPAGSALGMAVCAAGDLNQDGFQGEDRDDKLTKTIRETVMKISLEVFVFQTLPLELLFMRQEV